MNLTPLAAISHLTAGRSQIGTSLKRLMTLPGLDRRLPAAGALIAWVAVSPWLWGFSGSHAAVANHVFMVFSFGPLAMLIGSLRPAAMVTIVGGLWLVLSPWVLGYASDHQAWLNELVTGLLLTALSARTGGPAGNQS